MTAPFGVTRLKMPLSGGRRRPNAGTIGAGSHTVPGSVSVSPPEPDPGISVVGSSSAQRGARSRIAVRVSATGSRAIAGVVTPAST